MPGNQPASVLVVDDDPDICQLIKRSLEIEHIPVVTAENGGQALKRAADVKPKVVVLDMMLPDIDGSLVATELRRRYGSRLAILAISASNRGVRWAAEIGAFSFLEKPFEIEHLLIAVRRGLAD